VANTAAILNLIEIDAVITEIKHDRAHGLIILDVVALVCEGPSPSFIMEGVYLPSSPQLPYTKIPNQVARTVAII
jgi:hypothetical protein